MRIILTGHICTLKSNRYIIAQTQSEDPLHQVAPLTAPSKWLSSFHHHQRQNTRTRTHGNLWACTDMHGYEKPWERYGHAQARTDTDTQGYSWTRTDTRDQNKYAHTH